MTVLAGVAVAAALLSAAAGDTGAEPVSGVRDLVVKARRIASFGAAGGLAGRLTFLGGLELRADDGDFGSISGLDFGPDGRLAMVTDRGWWISAALREDGHAPLALDDAWIAPMLDPYGAHPVEKALNDAEALRFLPAEGVALVAFEGTPEIRAFALPLDLAAAPRRRALPGFVRNVHRKRGLEALAVAPADGPLAGALVAIAERSLDAAGNHRGFILDGPRAGAFTLTRSGDFDVTDAVFLPNGDLLVLERRFSFSTGLGARLRLVHGETLRPGRVLVGEVLLDAGLGQQIDNLEGIAVRPGADGGTVLTLVSDDNHNIIQRSLLLQFALSPPSAPLPRPRPAAAVR